MSQKAFQPTFEIWQIRTLAANMELLCELAHEASFEEVEEMDYEAMATKWLREIRVTSPTGWR